MKDKELDLEILENADDADIRRIADNCLASESDKERMFAMSRKIYKERTKESNETPAMVVSGVEIYKKPLWQKIVSAAAVIALVAGGAAGGLAMLKRNQTGHNHLAQEGTLPTVTETENNYPFGDLSNDRVLIRPSDMESMVFEPSEEVFLELASAFQSGKWTATSNDTPVPDDENVQLFFYNNGNSYKLVLYSDHTILWDNGTETARYSVSEEIEQAVYNAANHYTDSLDKMIYIEDSDDPIHDIWINISVKQEGISSEDIKYYTVYNPVLRESQQFTDFTWSISCKKDDFSYSSSGYGLLDNVTALINKAEWKETGVKIDMFDKRCISIDLYRYNNDMQKSSIISNLSFDISESGDVSVMYYGNEDIHNDYNTEEDAYRYYVVDENSKNEIKTLIDNYFAEYNELLENSSPDKFIEHFGCSEIKICFIKGSRYPVTLSESEKENFLNALYTSDFEETGVPARSGSVLFELTGTSQAGNNVVCDLELIEKGLIREYIGNMSKGFRVSDEFYEYADKLADEKYKGYDTDSVNIPPLTNMHSNLAKQLLIERGLKVRTVEMADSTVQPGYVIKSEPAEGETVPKGSEVTLFVCSDLDNKDIATPDFRGKTVNDAAVMAGYYGFKVRTEMVTSAQKEGTVLFQYPSPLANMPEDMEIILYISNGNTSEGVSEPVIKIPDNVSGRFSIDYIITRENDTTAVISGEEFSCPGTTEINIPVEEFDDRSTIMAYITNNDTNSRIHLISFYCERIGDKNVISSYDSEDLSEVFSLLNGN